MLDPQPAAVSIEQDQYFLADDDLADEDILYETLESNLKINSYESIETEESIVGISISI